MSGKVRWGVIGSGGIARRRTIPEGFVPATNATLVSVYGTNVRTNSEVADQFKARACGSIDELLETDIAAVYIASPVHAHVGQALQCAAAGKHVFCEKPLGLNQKEAEQIVSACETAKVQCGTAFMMRFHSQNQAAAKLVRDGKIGQPVFGRAQLSCWYPPMDKAWRQEHALAGGGSLIDMGSHCIDLLELCFGPVASVSCQINNTIHAYETEDSAVVLLKFANGALGTVDVFFCIQDASSRNVLELYGSKGSILASGTIGQGSQGEMKAYLSPEDATYQSAQARAPGEPLNIKPEPVNIYRAEIEAFSQAILENRPFSIDGRAGLRNQRITDACYESARLGQAVKI